MPRLLGFPKGESLPPLRYLSSGGVNTPPAKWLRLLPGHRVCAANVIRVLPHFFARGYFLNSTCFVMMFLSKAGDNFASH
ncbi:MAG: hypothetical protein HW419_985 [Deltaproteobacteria bacterium]|nr:hypothetical protein [Deltaproteobacteria bacterium]